MKTITPIAIFCMCSTLIMAQNADITATADIASVIIYNSSAEILYEKEIDLPPGKTTITFTDLTPFIVDNTFNVSTSSSDVDIMTVTEKINYTKEKKQNNQLLANLHDSLAYYYKDLGLLNCKLDALNTEKALLFKDESIGGVAKGVPVSEIEKASTFFSKRYLELATELFRTTERQKISQENYNRNKNQINELTSNTSQSGSEIRVTVVNQGSKGKVMFRFKFLTGKSGWAPSYDFKYQGATNPLRLVFNANVFNATGTPWENVTIKLSTASPTNGFNAPSMSNVTSNADQKIKNVNGVEFREIAVSNSIAEYDISQKYSIPSDAKPYLIDVNSYNITAEYNYLPIPKLDAFGFLMAKIPDWNKYNLIPGTTNIYNKGSYMGKTFLNTYPENDTLTLYLGKDNNVQSTIKETNTTNSRNIIGNYLIDASSISIAVKNSSNEKLNIELIDQVPVFNEHDKSKFSIENIEQAIYNKNEGLLTWQFSLAPAESFATNYQYVIKVPKDDIGVYKSQKKKFRTIACPSY